MRVAVAGPPSSGNYMLKSILGACGCDFVKVCHGNRAETLKEMDFVVVLVRGANAWIESGNEHNRFKNDFADVHWLGKASTHHEAHQVTYRAYFKAILKYDIPFAIVSYESLITDTDDTIKKLCEWIGLTFPGWENMPSENKKGQALKPFDANDKYRNLVSKQ